MREASAKLPLPEAIDHVNAASGLVAHYKKEKDGQDRLENLTELGPIGLVACSLLFVWALVGGFGATSAQGHEFFENPATVLIWVDFWIALGVVSTLVGDVWDFVSPLNAAVRLVDRRLAAREVAPVSYPRWLGRWPAFVLLLVSRGRRIDRELARLKSLVEDKQR